MEDWGEGDSIMPTIGVIPRVLFEGPRVESDRLYRTVVGRSLSAAERARELD